MSCSRAWRCGGGPGKPGAIGDRLPPARRCHHGPMSTDWTSLPADLPVPVDDGAADHLPGSDVPAVALPSTLGGEVDLADAARDRVVVYVYPRTGTPGQPSPEGWDDIPGARG